MTSTAPPTTNTNQLLYSATTTVPATTSINRGPADIPSRKLSHFAAFLSCVPKYSQITHMENVKEFWRKINASNAMDIKTQKK